MPVQAQVHTDLERKVRVARVVQVVRTLPEGPVLRVRKVQASGPTA